MSKDKLIYVEDDEDMLDLVESVFSDTNIEIIKSTKRNESLDIIKNNNIKCIISDYSMPNNELDCFEFFKEVKNIEEDIPFIIFTGKGSEDIASKSLSLGVDEYIQKGTKDSIENLKNSVKKQIIRYNNSEFSKITDKSPINIIDKLDNGILIMDKNYNIIYSNNKAESLLEEYSDFTSIQNTNLKDITKKPKKFYNLCEEAKEDGKEKIDVAYNEIFKEWFSFKIQTKDDKITLIFDTLRKDSETNIYEKVVNNTNDIITILDESGTVKYQTPSITKLGYEQDELYNKNIFNKIHPEDRQKVIKTFQKLKNNQKDHPLKVEYRIKTKNNDYIWCESRSMYYNNIKEMGFVISTRIITERKQKERDLKIKNNRLKDIVKIMNHDIPNHITIINGGIYKIKEDYPEEAKRIENGCERIMDLLKDLKKIGETKELNKRSNNIQKIISKISIENESKLDIKDDFNIEADTKEIKRLFENLIWNAVQHNENKVKIKIGLLENKKGFFVEDNGSGIDELEEVFNIGYSTKSSHTGLGLSFVKSVANQHGWDYSVKEGEEGGARFEFNNVNITKNI